MPKPLIHLRSNGPLKLVEATAAEPLQTKAFRALGYRQTLLPAAEGGKANANGFRFRNGGMRALGRSFTGAVFLNGHVKGDVRARGGDIVKAFAEELGDDEMAIYYDIVAKAPWAIEGLANGTIDRFSLGVEPIGEITCTVHKVPVWSSDECWCWPGMEIDGVISEWEYEDGKGKELSAVNVPAVEGTGIVAELGVPDYRELAALCGRQSERASRAFFAGAKGGDPAGGFTRAARNPTMTPSSDQPRGNQMDIRQLLGLPADATDEQVKAKIATLNSSAAQSVVLQTQLEQSTDELAQARTRELIAHVDSEIAKLKATKQVGDKVVESLRASADPSKGGSKSAFDQALGLVTAAAADLAPVAGAARGDLQSDKKPAAIPGATVEGEEGPDAFEQHKANPNLALFMRRAGVTAEDVRKHGARQLIVLPNIRELADATALRR